MIIRSMTLRSSRTLFRLQSYPISRSRASPDSFWAECRNRSQMAAAKTEAISGTSESRSRSGGTRKQVDAEAEVEVLTEPARSYLGLQVPVGSRHHSRLNRDGAIAPDAGNDALLENAQELGLSRQRQLPNLVQEQGAALRGLEGPFPGGRSAGEGPALMAEELTLDQILGQGGAIDGDEWGSRTGPEPMKIAGDELLAGAALSHDQDRTGNRSHPGNGLPQPPNGRAIPNERGLAELALKGGDFGSKPLSLQHAFDLPDHALHRFGLVDEAVRAEAARPGYSGRSHRCRYRR